jgi:periplasmic divalent cation tolerance protein
MESDFAVVLTTIPADADGADLAKALIEERLAACVNVLAPMTSIYRWKGEVETAQERQLLIKTTSARVPALQKRLQSLHSYEVPEFLVLSVAGGAAAYLRWIRESVD